MSKKVLARLIVIAVTLLVLSTFIKTDNAERITFGNKRILSSNKELIVDNKWSSNIITSAGERFLIQMNIYDFDDEFGEGTTMLLKGNENLEITDIRLEKIDNEVKQYKKYYQTYSLFINATPSKSGEFKLDDMEVEITGNKDMHKINLGKFNLNVYPKEEVGTDLEFMIGSSFMSLGEDTEFESQDYFKSSFDTEIDNKNKTDIVIKEIRVNDDKYFKLEKLKNNITIKPGKRSKVEVPFTLDRKALNYCYSTEILYSFEGKDKRQITEINSISNYIGPNQLAEMIKQKSENKNK
jgi:hypothetical protein